MLSMIAAIGKNRELGKDNRLLWHIPGDLTRFRKLTTGHPIIMGRNTHISIGKVLPNRTNIVLSKTKVFGDEVLTAKDLNEALQIASRSPGNDEVFIIGGAKVYDQTINMVDRLYLTIVDASAPADVFFPDYSKFSRVISDEHVREGEYSYSFKVLGVR